MQQVLNKCGAHERLALCIARTWEICGILVAILAYGRCGNHYKASLVCNKCSVHSRVITLGSAWYEVSAK